MKRSNRVSTHPAEVLFLEFLLFEGKTMKSFHNELHESLQEDFRKFDNNEAPITEALANEFARVLGTSAEFWLNLQKKYDTSLKCCK